MVKGSGWRVAGVVVAGLIALMIGSAVVDDGRVKAQTGSVSVSVEGKLTGENYQFADRGTLYTDAEYESVYLEVFAARTGKGGWNRAPVGRVVFEGRMTCTVHRAYQWSTESGSNVRMTCNRYEDLDTLRASPLPIGQMDSGVHWEG